MNKIIATESQRTQRRELNISFKIKKNKNIKYQRYRELEKEMY